MQIGNIFFRKRCNEQYIIYVSALPFDYAICLYVANTFSLFSEASSKFLEVVLPLVDKYMNILMWPAS
jgi:hypothetical protein